MFLNFPDQDHVQGHTPVPGQDHTHILGPGNLKGWNDCSPLNTEYVTSKN